MSTFEIKDANGAAVESIDLNDAVFGIEPNVPVMHRTVKAFQAGLRQGTANTKTRGEVRGGGKKPWRQKGTGHARQGTIRAPHWAGGGVVFGPHTRSYEQKVNNKEVKLAMRSALSAKLADGELIVVKDFDFETPSTKAAVAALKALGCDRKTTLVIADDAINTWLSFRNIPSVIVLPVSCANTMELLDNKKLVLTTTALTRLEEVLA